jgi:PAS domain S-box-containing protein
MSGATTTPRESVADQRPDIPVPAQRLPQQQERRVGPGQRQPPALVRAAVAGGLLVAMFGCLEMAAWPLRLTALLRFGDNYVPIKFNTALALAVTGIAMAVAVSGPTRWTRLAGALDLAIGATVLLEYGTGWDLHVDQLFVHDYLVPSGTAPGRLAANTAACLAVTGVALLIWRPMAAPWRAAALGGASVLVGSVAVVALFGYLIRLPSAYGWGHLASMALPTALAMSLLAATLFILTLATTVTAVGEISEWIAVPTGVTAFAVTALIWQSFIGRQRDSRVLPIADAAHAALLLAVLAGALLALTTWVGQRANRGRHHAESLAHELHEEIRRRSVAEAATRDSEHLLFGFLEAIPVGVFVVDPAGRPYYANQVAQRLLGRGVVPDVRAEDLPEAYACYLTGTEQPYPSERMPTVRALVGESAHVDDMEVQHKDGRRLLEVWGTPLLDEHSEVRFSIAAFVDITQRRAAEGELSEKATLLDLASDAIFIRDADRHITYWNRGAETTFGWSKEEVLGTVSLDLLRTELPAPIDELEGLLQRDGHWEGELISYDRAGRRIVEASHWMPQFRGDGSLKAVMSINTDISAQKAAEEELRRRAAELEELNRDLKRSNDDLQQFAYAASHDLAEPLRAISGPVSLIARRYQGQLDEDADRFIGFAVDGCERMQALINDLLAFSRIGRVEGRIDVLDTDKVLAAVLAALRPTLDERAAKVEVGDLPQVRANVSQLRQLFQNLIGNSVKFTPPDVRPHVRIACRHHGDYWRFTVTDNGIGIAPQHRQRVFGMFKRLHGREDYPGTGIGLALCHKIVEWHGGEIGVDDGPGGVGSTFWFTLPTREKATA